MLPYRPAAMRPMKTASMLPTVSRQLFSVVQNGLIRGQHTPNIRRHPLVGEGVCVLSLVMIAVASINHVDRINEKLSTPHSLDEVTRSSHFRLSALAILEELQLEVESYHELNK